MSASSLASITQPPQRVSSLTRCMTGGRSLNRPGRPFYRCGFIGSLTELAAIRFLRSCGFDERIAAALAADVTTSPGEFQSQSQRDPVVHSKSPRQYGSTRTARTEVCSHPETSIRYPR